MDQIYHLNRFIVSTKADNITYVKWEFQGDIRGYFEKYYGNNKNRIDELHVSGRGFEVLLTALRATEKHLQVVCLER